MKKMVITAERQRAAVRAAERERRVRDGRRTATERFSDRKKEARRTACRKPPADDGDGGFFFSTGAFFVL